MDCSPPGFSVRGTFQARILEWVANCYFRRSSWPGIKRESPVAPLLAGGDFAPLGKPLPPRRQKTARWTCWHLTFRYPFWYHPHSPHALMPCSCLSSISLTSTVCLPELSLRLPSPPHVLFSNKWSRPAHLHTPSGLANLLLLLLSWQFGAGPVQMRTAKKPASQLMKEHSLCSQVRPLLFQALRTCL